MGSEINKASAAESSVTAIKNSINDIMHRQANPLSLDSSVFTNGTTSATDTGLIFGNSTSTGINLPAEMNVATAIASYSSDSDRISAIGCVLANTKRILDQRIQQSLNSKQSQTTATGNGQNGQKSVNLNNGADVFKTVTSENVKDMTKMEEDIKAKEKELEDAKIAEKAAQSETDKKAAKDKAKAAAQKLNQLRADYDKLDKKYGNGTSLSSKYGTSGNFYVNLDSTELEQIESANAKIDGMKADLKAKEKELETAQKQQEDKLKEMLKDKDNAAKYEQLRQKGDLQGIKDMISSKDDQENYLKLEKDIQEQKEAISAEIDTLSAYIKAAGKDKESVDYDIHKADAKTKAENEKKESDKKDVANGIANSLFDDKGKVKTQSDITKALKEKFKDNSAYDEDTINNIAKFIHNKIGNKSKNDFLASLDDNKFFTEIAQNADFNASDDVTKKNLQLLIATYDALKGDGAFEKKANATAGSLKTQLTNALKKLKEAPKTSAPEEKKTGSDKTPAQPEAAETPAERIPETGKASSATDATVPLKAEIPNPEEKKVGATATHPLTDTPTPVATSKSNAEIKTAIEAGKIDELSAEDLVQYFGTRVENKNSKTGAVTYTTIGYPSIIKLFNSGNYEAIKNIILKLNDNAEKSNINERICADTGFLYNSIEFKVPNNDRICAVNNNTDNSQIKDYGSTTNIYSAIIKMAYTLAAKQKA